MAFGGFRGLGCLVLRVLGWFFRVLRCLGFFGGFRAL